MSEVFPSGIEPPCNPYRDDGSITLIEAANKSGEIHDVERTQGGEVWMPAVFGSYFAHELHAALTLDEAAQEERWNELRQKPELEKSSPWEVMGWTLLAYDAVEPIRSILGPDEVWQANSHLSEVQMNLSANGKWAVRKAAERLEQEQKSDGSDTDIADAIRRGLLISNPGEATGIPDDYIESLLRNAQSTDELDELVYMMRSHHLAGDLAMFQNIRADLINVKYEEGNPKVKDVADLFLQVLRSGKACDPDELNKIVLPTYDGGHMRGPKIVHEAARLIMSGDLTFQIGEVKTLTHIGAQYKGFDEICEANGYRLQAIMSDKVLENRANRGLLTLYKSYVYDIAKTSLAFWAMFRIAENEYHTQAHTFRGQGELLFDADTRRPDDEPIDFIDPTLVMRHVDKILIPVDADIRPNGRKVPSAADLREKVQDRMTCNEELQAKVLDTLTDDFDPLPRYEPNPKLEELGIPLSVDVACRYVKSEEIERLWRHWAWELAEPNAAKRLAMVIEKILAESRKKQLAKVALNDADTTRGQGSTSH